MSTQPKTDVRVMLSVGIMLIALFHAASLSVFQTLIPPLLETQEPRETFPVGGLRFQSQQGSGVSGTTNTVNTAARDEMKQQLPLRLRPGQQPNCVPCDQILNPQPALPAIQPAIQPKSPQSLKVTAPPTIRRPSISVFVRHDDPLSRQLLGWFDHDMKTLKEKVNYQVYTKDSPMYRARYASVTPVEAFPAVLFTDSDGGHIHAVDRSSMPSSALQLWSDMKTALELQQAIVSQVPTPPPKQKPVGFIDSNQAEDCPDGQCDPETKDRSTLWDKLFGKRDRGGGLFPSGAGSDQSVEGLLRMLFRPGETLMMACLVVCFAFAAVYFLKRNR